MPIILSATTHKIQIVTTTSSQIDAVISYVDVSSNSTSGATQTTTINSITSSDVVSSPASNVSRCIKDFSIVNAGTSSNSLTFNFVANLTSYEMFRAELSQGESISWSEQGGWKKYNSYGIPTINGIGAPVDVQVFSTPGNYTWQRPKTFKPTVTKVIMWGGGGGGGSAPGVTGAVTRVGGLGGGGGACNEAMFPSSDLGDFIQVIVGEGGAGGARSTVYGTNGTAGGYSSFEKSSYNPLLRAYGGGPGSAGTISAGSALAGGTGGGKGSTGLRGWTNWIRGGLPGYSYADAHSIGGNGGGSPPGNTGGESAEYGGAGAGGSGTSGTGGPGGVSIHGGGGGGAGAGTTATPAVGAAGGGGNFDGTNFATGGGVSAGGSGVIAKNGDDGPDGTRNRGGGGGGGGGSTITTGHIGGNGGNGGHRGGGGGGGGSGMGLGGAGGKGGDGEVVILTW